MHCITHYLFIISITQKCSILINIFWRQYIFKMISSGNNTEILRALMVNIQAWAILLSWTAMHWLTFALNSRAPTPIELGGTYAHSPSPAPPLSLERISKDIPPISGIVWLPLAIKQKNTRFSWFSQEIFPRLRPKKTRLFPEKMGMWTCKSN